MSDTRSGGLLRGWNIIICHSWFNVLIVFIPVAGSLTNLREKYNGIVFLFCFLALIPLVKLHDLTTRELAIRIGGSKTGLLNASMGNIVEVVVAVSALQKCELRFVQSSLIGAILSKLLLVLGLCFLAGGIRFSEQIFDATTNQVNSSLLSISVGVLLLPAVYHFALSGTSDTISDPQKRSIFSMSYGVSIILILVYLLYLSFQLVSHPHLYKDRNKKSNKNRLSKLNIFRSRKLSDPSPLSSSSGEELDKCFIPVAAPSPLNPVESSQFLTSTFAQASLSTSPYNCVALGSEITLLGVEPTVRLVDPRPPARSFTGSTLDSEPNGDIILDMPSKGNENYTQDSVTSPQSSEMSYFQPREPQLSWTLTIFLLVVVTVSVALVADWLVESLDGTSLAIRKPWVAMILLPAVSSIAECVTAMSVSFRDQLHLSIAVAVGSTVQTAMFVIPLMVVFGWLAGRPLSLLFDPFESVVLYIAVQTMTHVVAQGQSNWLDGVILIGLYVIIGVSFWFYPGSGLSTSLAVCSESNFEKLATLASAIE